MHKIVILLITTPLIYLVIAASLVYFPFERNTSAGGLDFDGIRNQDFSLDTVEELDYVARDTTNLFYRYIEGKSGLCIVLIHGSGSEGRYLVPMADALNGASDVTVVIPDLRGHGRSQGGSPGDVNYIGQFEHDLEDLLNHLRRSSKIKRVVIGGHSSGGGLAVKYSGNTLSKFDGSVLLAPYLGHSAPTVRPNSGGWVQVANLRYAGLAMLNNIGITGLNNLPVLFFNRPAAIKDELQLDSYSYRLNESFSPQAYKTDLANNPNPILLLAGDQDESFYPNEFENILTSYAPHAELHILKNIKHLELVSSKHAATLVNQWLKKTFD